MARGRTGHYGPYKKSLALTEAEVETLQLISEGYSRKDMAIKLFVGDTAIEYRIRRVTEKLGAQNVPHAVAIGINRGIITGA